MKSLTCWIFQFTGSLCFSQTLGSSYYQNNKDSDMKKLIIVLLIVFGGKGIAQNATTYKIERLKPPTKFLYQLPSSEVFKLLKANIEKRSQLPDSIVAFGEHPRLA